MTRAAGRFSEALERLLPFVVIAAVVAIGYMAVVRPRLDAYLATRADAAALRQRVQTLQASVERSRALAPADTQASLAAFEARVSGDDTVADVAALLARAVLDSAPAGQLRGFTIDTGDRPGLEARSAPRGAAQDAGSAQAIDGPDARVGLFPHAVAWTPVRVTFESTFQAIGTFLSKIRDLPTLVEIRSARLTRGLPLMKLEVVIRVYQRGAPGGEGSRP